MSKIARVVLLELPIIKYGVPGIAVIIWGAYYGFLGSVIQIAKSNPELKGALFDSVSGRRTYRRILIDALSVRLSFKIFTAIIQCFISKITKKRR